jgi:integrase
MQHRPDGAPPLLTEHVRQIVDALRKGSFDGDAARVRALRDVAVILLGFAGALRRSEIAAVETGHLNERPQGLGLEIPRSKTDQTGEGQVVGITATGTPYCPVQAVRDWQDAASITSGALFRGVHRSGTILDRGISDRTVNNIVKGACETAGLSVDASGHSLRVGHITQATINNVPDGVIRAQSRHKDEATFFGYQRVDKALKNSSSSQLGL